MVLLIVLPLVFGVVSLLLSLALGLTRRIIPYAVAAGLAWGAYQYLVDRGTISGF